MRRLLSVLAVLGLAACEPTVSTTTRLDVGDGGVPYVVPTGLVPIIVFADASGIGITIEPAITSADGSVGTLVARIQPNPFNNEVISVDVNKDTGFLSTVTSDSTAQVAAIAEEAAKAARRLSFQNARAEALKTRVVVLQDTFDPLNQADVLRINKGIDHALQHAARAFARAELIAEPGAAPATSTRGRIVLGDIKLRVTMPDGSNPFAARRSDMVADVVDCSIGICARIPTSRMIRIEHDGAALGGFPVTLPSKELIPMPVSSRLFANQKTSITVQEGMISAAQVDRQSEVLGIVKIPGQILRGLITGFTEGVDDETTVINKQIELIKAQEKLETEVAAQSERASVGLQNASVGGGGAARYTLDSLTVYPFSNALQGAIANQINLAAARRKAELEAAAQPGVAESGTDGALLNGGTNGDAPSEQEDSGLTEPVN